MGIDNLIKYHNNFPHKGIRYVDIQPLLANEIKFKFVIEKMGEMVKKPVFWIGVESRGFLFASALTIRFGGGLKMIRKKGKLPGNNLLSIDYCLEYGLDTIQIEKSNERVNVVIVDDIFATGGTLSASEKLCELANYNVTDIITFIDLNLNESKPQKLKSLYTL